MGKASIDNFMKKFTSQSGKLLADLFWNLVLLALAGGFIYVAYTRGYLDPYLKKMPPNSVVLDLQSGSNASRPAALQRTNTPPTGPVSPSANALGMAPFSTAPDQVQAGDLGTLPAEQPIALSTLDRRFVPGQVTLLKPTEIPILFNGKPAGKISTPAGTVLNLASIQGDQVEVQEGESTRLIPATDTDIMLRVRTLMRVLNAAPIPVR
jgi:hypothetical protein